MYEEDHVISKTDDTIVSRIWYPPINNYACQKQILFTEPTSQKKCYREINTLSFLNNNPNCIKIYEVKEIVDRSLSSINLITEFCEYGNLLNFSNTLMQYNTNFYDRYLIYYVKKSIKFLSKLQTLQISHRDIKPENLFVDSSGDLKFGDFGSSTSTLGTIRFTIQGSPYYISPELRDGYNNYLEGRGGPRIIYSPFKADVYSLGLIFLYLSTMDPPDDRFCDLEDLEQIIETETENIRHPYIKRLAKWMLKVIPNDRPDFITLEKDVFSNNLFQCYKCLDTDNAFGLSCETCYRDYHLNCLHTNTCENCQSQLKFSCGRCGKECFDMSKCKHLLCGTCVKENLECKDCCPLYLIEDRQVDLGLLPVNIRCCWCGMQCNSMSNYYICHSCKLKYCRICKRENHVGACVSVELGKVVYCLVCGELVKENVFEDIFFQCRICGYRCIVCFESIDRPHGSCSLMISRVC